MIYLPDPQYNPNFLTNVTSKTKLADGISISKFLGGYGDRITMDHITDIEEQKQLARNLILQTNLFQSFQINNEFNNLRLIIAEGVYRKAPNELLTTNSVNDYAQTGRSIVYEVINLQGEIAKDETYDVAEYWANANYFDKISLNYDTYDVNKSLHAQIVVTVPTIPSTYDVRWKFELETNFNSTLLSSNDLIEISTQ